MGLIANTGIAAAVASFALASGILRDDDVTVRVTTPNATSVAFAVSDAKGPVWRSVMPCSSVNVMTIQDINETIRDDATQAFARRENGKRAENFNRMVSLVAPAYVHQAVKICEYRQQRHYAFN